MQDKILSVFYGEDRLPYKDASRETHYPIVNGNVFNGANNVTKIRYYLDRIGGFANVTWVVVSKLPNGQLASEVLNSNQAVYDEELGENYIDFEISSYYTTLKGDVYLSLQGYQGGVEMEQDEDTGIYSIYGTPTIQATGSIKIGVNYAPQIVQGTHFTTSDLQQVLGLISEKANISDVVFNFGIIPNTTTLSQLYGLVNSSNKPCVIDFGGYKFGSIAWLGGSNYSFEFEDVRGVGRWVGTNVNAGTLLSNIFTTTSTYYQPYATQEYVESNYAKSSDLVYTRGNYLVVDITTTTIGDIYSNVDTSETFRIGGSNVLFRGTYLLEKGSNLGSNYNFKITCIEHDSVDMIGRYWQTTLGGVAPTTTLQTIFNNLLNTPATTKYVNDKIADFMQKEYQNVDTTTYPTLDDFLASTGEEGYIYLYPIDPSDETKGYYQYIWENDEWVSLGTTTIDLSGYVEKTTSANKVYATDYQGEQTTISVDSFYEGNIARRDSDNSITVPLTPTQNGHASSKKYVDDKVSDLSNEVDTTLEDYAKVDGNYPTMTVGSADALTPYGENSGANDNTPFVFQSAGGSSDIGSQAQLKALRGNSVALNQKLHNELTSSSTEGHEYANNGTLTISNGKMTITSTGLTPSYFGVGFGNLGSLKNHRVLCIAYISAISVANTFANISFEWGLTNITDRARITTPKNYTYALGTWGSTQTAIYLNLNQGTPVQGDYFVVENYMIFDLTLMFGAGKEPTSVLEFNRLFPKPYYPYNAGTLLSCKSNGYKTVGYNAFDGQWEAGSIIQADGTEFPSNNAIRSDYIKVICGQSYTFEWNTALSPSEAYWFYYDIDKNYIGYRYFGNTGNATIPQNCSYIRLEFIKTGWGTNIPTNLNACLHLTWDNSRTGYEPYESETYPLPNIELRSAGNVYDELKPDGTLIRRVGVIDLGTLSWGKKSNNRFASGNELQNIIKTWTDYQGIPNLRCGKYSLTTPANIEGSSPNDKSITMSGNGISVVIYDSAYASGDAAAFKTAMSGVYLYYELATLTEEQTEYTFAETTPIDDYGTQEFLYDSDIDIPIPQGNEFFYPVDYKAFVDSLGGRNDIEYAADQVVSQTQLTQALSTFLSTISGYDATKTQTLKNVGGVLQWVDD